MSKNLEIAKLIGAPIDSNLKVPFVISEIADVETAEPGELVRTLCGDDSNGVDTVYTVDGNGAITVVKVGLNSPSTLTFAHLNSKLEYVLLSEVADSPDQGALARRKVSISRAMDKIEVKRILDAILAVASQEVATSSAEDIYTLIKKMVRTVENYGDNYILLCGTTAYAEIDDFDKDNASTFQYNVEIKKMIADAGIKLVKVTGNIKLDSGSDLPLLAVDKMILVARDSTLAIGKPIVFIRRKISGIVGGQADVVNERALFVAENPSPLYNDAETLGYGIYGYESLIQAIVNYRALAWTVVL